MADKYDTAYVSARETRGFPVDPTRPRMYTPIAYQEYNTKSPLNGLAAKWASQNAALLPIDARPIAPPLKRQEQESSALGEVLGLVALGQEHSVAAELSVPMPNPWPEKIVIESKG